MTIIRETTTSEARNLAIWLVGSFLMRCTKRSDNIPGVDEIMRDGGFRTPHNILRYMHESGWIVCEFEGRKAVRVVSLLDKSFRVYREANS